MAEKIYSYQHLFDFTTQVFKQIGCPAEQAELAAEVLLSADLRGIDSHGVARLSGYVRLWEAKRVNANPVIRIIHETPSTAVVDGDSGLGLVVAPFAMQVAIEKAKNVGTGWVSVQNSNHFGIAGYHAMMACDVLLMIGTDFPYQQFFPKEATIVQIDARGEQLGRRTKVDLGLVGDTKTTLRALLPKLAAHEDDRHLQAAREHYVRER